MSHSTQDITYLNHNSTANPLSIDNFNPSDPYDENVKLRQRQQLFENKIKRLVGASKKDHVIFTSGATESIATCVNWARYYNQYGIVCGSDLDHPSVKRNCKTYGMCYVNNVKDNDPLTNYDNISLLFITHTSPLTGEVMDVEEFAYDVRIRTSYSDDLIIKPSVPIKDMILEHEDGLLKGGKSKRNQSRNQQRNQHVKTKHKNNLINNRNVIHSTKPSHQPIDDIPTYSNNYTVHEIISDGSDDIYKPIVVMDITQSVGKVPCNMKLTGVDAVFFSLHKISPYHEKGQGVMIIKHNPSHKFIPLIAGNQQNGMRGGTYPIGSILRHDLKHQMFTDQLYSNNLSIMKSLWNDVVTHLEENNVEVIRQERPHLHSTVLIKVPDHKKPSDIVTSLSHDKIYVSSGCSCEAEASVNESDVKKDKSDNEDMNGVNRKRLLRLSFDHDTTITEEVLDKIIDHVK